MRAVGRTAVVIAASCSVVVVFGVLIALIDQVAEFVATAAGR